MLQNQWMFPREVATVIKRHLWTMITPQQRRNPSFNHIYIKMHCFRYPTVVAQSFYPSSSPNYLLWKTMRFLCSTLYYDWLVGICKHNFGYGGNSWMQLAYLLCSFSMLGNSTSTLWMQLSTVDFNARESHVKVAIWHFSLIWISELDYLLGWRFMVLQAA